MFLPHSTGGFLNPKGVHVYDNSVYIASGMENLIARYDFSAQPQTIQYFSIANPHGVFVDGAGIYIADTDNNRVANGNSSGNTNTTFPQGGASFSLNKPTDVIREWNGSADVFYVTDRGNNRVLKVINGIATVLAYVTGPNQMCRIGTNGDLLVTANHAIYRITTGGSVSVFAGLPGAAGYVNGTLSDARFNNPAGIWCNAAATLLYIADTDNNVVRKIALPVITPATTSIALYATCGSSPSIATQFSVSGVNLATNILATASANFEISENNVNFYASISLAQSAGIVSNKVLWVRTKGSSPAGNNTGSVTLTSTGAATKTVSISGTVVAQCPNILPQAYHVTTLAGDGEEGFLNTNVYESKFLFPMGVWSNASGQVYVADSKNNRIRAVNAGYVSTISGTGALSTTDGAAGLATFSEPEDICRDAAGNTYVAEFVGHVIRKISSGGTVTTIAGLFGSPGYQDGTGSSARFNFPSGICVDPTGTYLYVADTYNNKIRRVTIATGAVTTFAGSGTNLSGATNGIGTAALFNNPIDVSIDNGQNLFVTDKNNNLIRKIAISNASVTTYAGSGISGYQDGAGFSAKFSNLSGIVVDAQGIVYASDGDRIRKITSTLVTTHAGNGSYAYLNGAAAAASFKGAGGLAVDASGSVYVADSKSNVIRKIALQGVSGSYRFTTCPGTPSAPQTFVISGTNVNTNIAVTAPAGFEVSLSLSTGYTSSLTLAPVANTVAATQVYVRISAGAAAGTVNDNIVITSNGGLTKYIGLRRIVAIPDFTLTVTPDSKDYPSQVISAKSEAVNTYTWSPATNLTNLNNNQVMSYRNTSTAPVTYQVTAINGSCTLTKSVTVTAAMEGIDFDSYINLGTLTQANSNNVKRTNNNSTANGFINNVEQPSDDIFYKFTLTQTSGVTMNHCNTLSTSPYIYDSYLHLYSAYRYKIGSNDDYSGTGNCGTSLLSYYKRNLIPGTYYVISEGWNTNQGNITTNVSVAPCDLGAGSGYNTTNPVELGEIGCNYASAVNDDVSRCFQDVNGDDGPEAYYRFTVNSSRTVTFNGCSETLELALYILNSNGTVRTKVYDNNMDECGTVIVETLPAGTYYLVAESINDAQGAFYVGITTPACRLGEEPVAESKEKADFGTQTDNMSVYPNPTNGEVNVSFAPVNSGTIIVSDMMGREMHKQAFNSVNALELNLSNLPKGLYSVKLDGTRVSKIITIQ